MDLDTVLTAVYVVVDEVYVKHRAGRGPSRRRKWAELCDSEERILAILSQWRPRHLDVIFPRCAVPRQRSYVQRLVSWAVVNRKVCDIGLNFSNACTSWGRLTRYLNHLFHCLPSCYGRYRVNLTKP